MEEKMKNLFEYLKEIYELKDQKVLIRKDEHYRYDKI